MMSVSAKNIFAWNRKLHTLAGLFLLLFIWLFSLSGLILNHGKWKFTGFWDQRKEHETIVPVNIPADISNDDIIQLIMKTLEISGEVTNISSKPKSFDFRVTVPGINRDIHFDPENNLVTQKVMEFNFWGKFRLLHTFNGANRNNPEVSPSWIVTRLWALMMDIIASGLIFICLSSWLMWFEVRNRYSKGLYAFMLGFAIAIYFVFLVNIL